MEKYCLSKIYKIKVLTTIVVIIKNKLFSRSVRNIFFFSLVKETYRQIFNLKLLKILILPFVVYFFIDLILDKSMNNFDFSGDSWSTFFNNQNIAIGSRWFILASYFYYGFYGTFINGLNAVNKSNNFNLIQSFDPRKVFRLFKVATISVFFSSLGFLLFLFPGIVLTKRYLYSLIVALENKSLNVIESLNESKKLSMNKGWSVLLTLGVMILGHFLVLGQLMVPLLTTNGFLNILLLLIYKWVIITFPITFLYVSKEKFQAKI